VVWQRVERNCKRVMRQEGLGSTSDLPLVVTCPSRAQLPRTCLIKKLASTCPVVAQLVSCGSRKCPSAACTLSIACSMTSSSHARAAASTPLLTLPAPPRLAGAQTARAAPLALSLFNQAASAGPRSRHPDAPARRAAAPNCFAAPPPLLHTDALYCSRALLPADCSAVLPAPAAQQRLAMARAPL
jgi:hypothetical protein